MVLTLALPPLELQREVRGPRERRNIARMEVWDPRTEAMVARRTVQVVKMIVQRERGRSSRSPESPSPTEVEKIEI